MHVSICLLVLVLSCNVTPSPLYEKEETGDSARIVNGFGVDITQVPYQASLRRKVLASYSHMCGAVILTPRGVLTAAHCVSSYVSTPSSLQVVVGTASRLSGGKGYDISSVEMHEQYSSTTLENDIAMLITTKVISFSQSVHPIPIADEYLDLPSGTVALVSGFGTTSYEGTASSVLLAAHVNIVAQTTCARAYLRIASITNGMICAHASDPARDACQGDSGGPLVAKNLLIGIVSWGEGCADTAYPGVYTRVSAYNEWIRRKIALIY